MLISRRREGETVQIGNGIEIRIVTIRRNKVVFGIIAPREMKIVTGKLSEEALANTVAVANSAILGPPPSGPDASSECVVSLLKPGRVELSAASNDKEYGTPE